MVVRHVNTRQVLMRGELSGLQQYRVHLLLLALFVFPFVKIFGQLGNVSQLFQSFGLSQLLNYVAVACFTFVFLWQKARFSAQLLIMMTVLLAMLFANYLLSPLASVKWLFNWLGFIFVGALIAQIVKALTHSEMLFLQTRSVKLTKLLILAITPLVAFVWLTNIDDLLFYLMSGWSNHVIAMLSSNLGIEKQAFGILLVFIVLVAYTNWARLSKTTRAFYITHFIIMGPAIYGIRTMLLGLLLCGTWQYVTKRRLRKVTASILMLTVLLIFMLYQAESMELVSKYYDRLPSLKLALSVMSDYLFGLGNGGYQVFVEANNDALLKQFGSERMAARGTFWVAPESDLVYFIASWGILSAVFFGFFALFLLYGGRVLHRRIGVLPIERAMLLMAGAMIFMGISQDNAGGLIWWIYMAAGFGVVLRHRKTRDCSIDSQSTQHRTDQLILI